MAQPDALPKTKIAATLPSHATVVAKTFPSSPPPVIKWEKAVTLDRSVPQPAASLKLAITEPAHPRVFMLPTVAKASTLPSAPPPAALPKAIDGPYEVLSADWVAQKIATTGELMETQLLRPGMPMSLACFPVPGTNRLTVISSHAVGFKPVQPSFELPPDLLFDNTATERGACTRLVFDTVEGKVIRQELALGGTTGNTAGAKTPWGSFVSAERQLFDVAGSIDPNGPARHGYLFEVPGLAKGLAAPTPLPLHGALSAGAVCFDKVAEAVYLGEDKEDGLLFRFTPNLWGDMSHGGRMEVLGIEGFVDALAGNRLRAGLGQNYKAFWIKLPASSSAEDLHTLGLKNGAARMGAIRGLASSSGRLCIALPMAGTDGQLLALDSDVLKVICDPKGDEHAGPVRPGVVFYTRKGELVVAESREVGSRLLFQDKAGAWVPLLRISKGPIGGADMSDDGRFIFANLTNEGILVMLRQAE